jgi:hypothetical protein
VLATFDHDLGEWIEPDGSEWEGLDMVPMG